MFEVRATDLAGRVGRIKTRRGYIDTPCLLPVVHPIRQSIHPSILKGMGFQAVMTNAYTTWRYHQRSGERLEIHELIGFDGVVMTDSGGYQVLEYGGVEVEPVEMARFEEEIGSDIAIILDRPTGFRVGRRRAEETVRDTLKAAEETVKVRSRDVLWTGAIQGGRYLDLVEYSARELSKLGFEP